MTIKIAHITIGIEVDNSIQYIHNLKQRMNEKKSIKESIENSHKTVGKAVLTTSITIAFGLHSIKSFLFLSSKISISSLSSSDTVFRALR